MRSIRTQQWLHVSIERLCQALQRGARFFALLLFAGTTTLSHAAIPQAERDVLMALYTGSNGSGWSNRTNWRNPANTDFNSSGTECTWFGITCNGAGTQVTSIDLPNNGLNGVLPASLSAFNALTYLDLSGNALSGTISALSGLTSLQTVYFNGNQFTGAIPALSGLTSLQLFEAFNNQLNAPLPALTGLTALQRFDVSSNQIPGALPALTGLTQLQVFYARGNSLRGSLPSLSGLSALREFYVAQNLLTGNLPSLSGLAALEYFDVSQNELTGSIPSLSGLTSLQRFYVNNNQLTGAIPAVPAPSALLSENSQLCPNQLTNSTNAAWDAATPGATWDIGCISPRIESTLTFGAAPTLLLGGSGNVSTTVAPLPGSSIATAYTSLSPTVCSVDISSGAVVVLPAAIYGDFCTIAADKSGDLIYNSAPQAQQNIRISASVCSLDVNGDFSLSPATDGVLIARYLLGLRGSALTAGLTLTGSRTSANDIEIFLAAKNFSVRGLSAASAVAPVDGVVIMRYLQNLPAASLLGGTGIAPADTTTVFNRVKAFCS